MNEHISKLLQSLESDDETVQEEALLFLSMLLERHFSRIPNDPIYRGLLPDEVFAIEIGADEALSLIKELLTKVNSERLALHRRTALIGTLGKLCHVDALETILGFLQEHSDSLDDENAYQVIVAITPTYFAPNDYPAVQALLTKYRTQEVLNRLQKRRSLRLEEPLRRLLGSISKLDR